MRSSVITRQQRTPEDSLAQVEKQLHIFLSSKIRQAGRIDPAYADFIQQVAAFVARGGKRVRPQLVVLAYQGLGGKKQTAITKVAASQELFHSFALIHDDIIDRDQTRWGGPNISGHYQSVFMNYMPDVDARHFAESWALLAGDSCYGLCLEMLLNSGFDARLTQQSALILQRTLFAMLGGELLDTATSIFHESLLSERQLIEIARYKTSIYSFVTPLQIGALLAGGTASTLKQVAAFGHVAGIAFQLKDDILGVFGDEATTGKPSLSDIREGKQTVLMARAWQHTNSHQKLVLAKHFGNPKLSTDGLAQVKEVIVASGVLGQITELANDYTARALKLLPSLGFNASAQKQLESLTRSITGRTY
jgi:geranylgeranyl diphosphate synthase type II